MGFPKVDYSLCENGCRLIGGVCINWTLLGKDDYVRSCGKGGICKPKEKYMEDRMNE